MSELGILHSQIEGEGEPLLILHGVFGMLDNWKTLGKQWADSFQVHLIDQRNHGRSFHHADCSYTAMAEDLLRYMDYHKITSANILGHSMGGKTAMHFACLQPERVNKLIIADIGPQEYAPHHDDILAGLHATNVDEISSRAEADKAMASIIKIAGVRQFLLKNLYWKTDTKLDWRFNLAGLSQGIAEVVKALPTDYSYQKDCLFIRGTASGYITDADWDKIKLQFPLSNLASIKGAGHWLHAEKPEAFSNIIREYLA